MFALPTVVWIATTFHALETAQCMSERRRDGEVGIRHVQALRGDKLWEQMQTDERRITRDLFVAALTRSHNLPVRRRLSHRAGHIRLGSPNTARIRSGI